MIFILIYPRKCYCGFLVSFFRQKFRPFFPHCTYGFGTWHWPLHLLHFSDFGVPVTVTRRYCWIDQNVTVKVTHCACTVLAKCESYSSTTYYWVQLIQQVVLIICTKLCYFELRVSDLPQNNQVHVIVPEQSRAHFIFVWSFKSAHSTRLPFVTINTVMYEPSTVPFRQSHITVTLQKFQNTEKSRSSGWFWPGAENI